MKILRMLFLSCLFVACGDSNKSSNKQIVRKAEIKGSVNSHHDYFNTRPLDKSFEFKAYFVSMDGEDDGELLGVPEFVSYHIGRSRKLAKSPKRPSKWFETPELAPYTPKDDSYKHSGYSRGHMCMKHIAWRLGAEADRETHNTANACPQIQKFNAGIWLDMEVKTEKWADKFERIWVICGPGFDKNKKKRYIGDSGEMKVAIPDYFWKIVIRANDGVETLAFLYPHKPISKSSGSYRHSDYAVSIDEIEKLTGLDFLSRLDNQENIESKVNKVLWRDR